LPIAPSQAHQWQALPYRKASTPTSCTSVVACWTGLLAAAAYAYLKDVLTRLLTHKASRIGELLPHRRQLASD